MPLPRENADPPRVAQTILHSIEITRYGLAWSRVQPLGSISIEKTRTAAMGISLPSPEGSTTSKAAS